MVGHDDGARGFGQELPVQDAVPEKDAARDTRQGVGQPIDHGVAVRKGEQDSTQSRAFGLNKSWFLSDYVGLLQE